MLFRILTARRNKREVAAIVARFFDGFTLLEGIGYWKRQPELALVIEIETDELESVVRAAVEIKGHNEQNAVLIQQIPNHAWLV